MEINNILEGREERAKLISRYLVDYEVVVSVKANVPGNSKNNHLAYLIINAFSFLITKLKNNNYIFDFNADGPYLIITIRSGDAEVLKTQMMEVEETHTLGRFIDIDVHTKNGVINRENKRTCYLCSDLAINCMRRNHHSYDEIENYIQTKVYRYYSDLLLELVDASILHELNLHPKFGLVTPLSSGSHKDMDYALMVKAKAAILPYFIKIFFLFKENDINETTILSLKNIGLEAENSMLRATKNINAYKGLIFNLGIIIASFTIKISRYEPKNVFNLAEEISYELIKKLDDRNKTFGSTVYNKNKFPGVRGEALSGFKNVKRTLKKLENLSDNEKLKALVELIINVEDSTFLKRALSINEYQSVKEKFKSLNLDSLDEVLNLNRYCIKKSLSFGGSADLLVLTVFLHLINRDFYFIINGYRNKKNI